MNLKQQAISVINKNTTEHGITAGSTHFHDVWARDALYASIGALKHGLVLPVQRTLHTLQTHTSSQGQIPLRYGTDSMKKAFLHLPTKTAAVYGNDKTTDPALDPNSLYLIVLEQYLATHANNQLHDTTHIRKVADWLLAHTNTHGLLTEGSYASWDDALKKNAPSIYNNALAYKALHAATNLTTVQKYKHAAKRIKQASNILWNDTYYCAWQDMNVFDVAGNLLAIYTGLASKDQQAKILDTLDTYTSQANDVLAKTNYPRYPRKTVYYPFYLVGMADYHNQGPYWSWIAALEALVREDKREEIMKKLNEFVQHTNGIYEIYDSNKTPTKRLFYESEKDFSWTAGLLLASINN